MGRAPRVVGNPEWVEILEALKDKVESKDPNAGILFSYGKAIKSLKECTTRQSEPGEIKLKFIGRGIIETLKKELRKPRAHRLVTSYDSLQSSSGSSSDPASAADLAYTGPRLTATDKGKGRAQEYNPRIDERLHALAGIFGNPAFARQRQEESLPKHPSRDALSKAAAVEEAILVGLYTQCHETSQKTWKSEKELLMLAEPWMTHQTKVIGPRLMALTNRKHLDCHMRDTIPVYSFTWEGYCSAQTSAAQKGLPAIAIVQNDLVVPSPAPVAPVTKPTLPKVPSQRHTKLAKPAHAATRIAVEEEAVSIPHPQGIVSVNRNAPIAGNFATIVPRKRQAAALEETYQGLSQYTRAAVEESTDNALAAPLISHKPINKRFAAPTIASVFQDKPVAAPVTHSDVLAFLFTYLDEDDNRVNTPAEADLKPDPKDGTRMMYKIEFRARQARHPLAKIVHDVVTMTRSPPDPEGLTQSGWLAHSKAPPKCPGIGSLKQLKTNALEPVVAPAKKQSKSAVITSLMGGAGQQKKSDARAMYKLPAHASRSVESTSSPDKPHSIIARSDSSSVSRPALSVHAFATNEELINTIFGTSRDSVQASGSGSADRKAIATKLPAHQSSSVAAVPSPVASADSSPCKPSGGGLSKQAAMSASSSRLQPSNSAVSAATSTSVRTEPAPRLVGTKQASPREYTKSYSWALEDHLTFPGFNPIILDPRTFDVILQIDHREVKDVSSAILERTFSRKHIKFEVVNLILGDYLWVARRKIPLGDGYDEVVLAICERKRKDDFVDSIKDDRHINQKRRIKASGVTRCLYLVEDLDIRDNEHYETFTKAIQTSINQTLLIDGFSLHIADSHGETLAHLVRVSRALQQEMAPLNVIPDENVKHAEIAALQRYLERKEPEITYHISLRSFNRVVQPHTTVKSIWAKQVRHVCGMSEEQCVSLLDVYPTPAAFFEDLEDRMLCEMERESQGTVRYNKQSRKIQHFDPRNHVKNRIEPNNAYKPRPMGGPTTARLWHLATADDYSAREECFDFESQD
ncbi:hypothetical protein P389DRAFT_212495 [Cystobasidium minutum MCA 4210]|uniref:uncharacterized protein n=1 Tax=Cystobasidium minutum MCA 4210 TaxID=1397322 RepID=UPI0034CFC69F|eukprot:jgi/Rhomi1/212495/estExt_Genemark1.C_60425